MFPCAFFLSVPVSRDGCSVRSVAEVGPVCGQDEARPAASQGRRRFRRKRTTVGVRTESSSGFRFRAKIN